MGSIFHKKLELAVCFQTLYNFAVFLYRKTCLNRTLLGLKNLFSLDRCLVYTGSNYIDFE